METRTYEIVRSEYKKAVAELWAGLPVGHVLTMPLKTVHLLGTVEKVHRIGNEVLWEVKLATSDLGAEDD